MSYKKLILEKKDGICLLTMNNPSNLNALSPSTVAELSEAIDEIDRDDTINIVIMTGSGKAFIAGADILYMKDLDPIGAKAFARNTTDIYRKIEASSKVFIAAINGYALGGGCELSLSCDLRIASSRAKLGLPETNLGIIPGGGGTQRLPRLIGIAKSKELIFTGEAIDASEAYQIGLVNKVVEPDQLLEESYKMARRILKNGLIAIGYAKDAINKGLQADLNTAIDYENNSFGLCFSTEDQKEGMQAFSEKRPPIYEKR